jgi:hypothetical protein
MFPFKSYRGFACHGVADYFNLAMISCVNSNGCRLANAIFPGNPYFKNCPVQALLPVACQFPSLMKSMADLQSHLLNWWTSSQLWTFTIPSVQRHLAAFLHVSLPPLSLSLYLIFYPFLSLSERCFFIEKMMERSFVALLHDVLIITVCSTDDFGSQAVSGSSSKLGAVELAHR